MKSSKDRRKIKAEFKNKNSEEEKQKEINELKDRRLNELEEKLSAFEDFQKEHKKYSDKLDKLYQKWLIDLNGDLVNDQEQDPDFEEEIKSDKSDM